MPRDPSGAESKRVKTLPPLLSENLVKRKHSFLALFAAMRRRNWAISPSPNDFYSATSTDYRSFKPETGRCSCLSFTSTTARTVGSKSLEWMIGNEDHRGSSHSNYFALVNFNWHDICVTPPHRVG